MGFSRRTARPLADLARAPGKSSIPTSELKRVRLAYSPCPNDSYIFAAWSCGQLSDAPPVDVVLDDVEALNSAALTGRYELTKASYAAVPLFSERYRILRAGGALGRGCGPLVVTQASGARSLDELKEVTFAIPGELTTAFLLLRLALGTTPKTVSLRFDRIVDAVRDGQYDAGVIIHESRFTYARAGLVLAADLGEWWEAQTGLPIPLGAILARRDLEDETVRRLNETIRASLHFSREHDAVVMPYVRRHAAELDEDVMRAHIALYVNEFSDDVGVEGERAIDELFQRAAAAGFLEAARKPEFAC